MHQAPSRYGHRVNLALLFQATSIFLVIFTLQLVLYGLHELTEANLIPFIDNAWWHQATEDWAEGKAARWITGALVVAPLAWIVIARCRGHKVFQTTPPH